MPLLVFPATGQRILWLGVRTGKEDNAKKLHALVRLLDICLGTGKRGSAAGNMLALLVWFVDFRSGEAGT